ncbi:HDOD domain-containing protein [Roseburia sp. OF03-24]|uniref:EAL and HDOD domain-containing protein n=1 Tax=Roseburia TaxID=841 RepID=UPI000E4EA07E|nr:MULTISPECIES: HDOD domain-containing protein [Roseburia]RGX91775.1 HDOD domain-containing protein [Roseburia sp. OF03-24]RHF93877.1 HDOD domain-containing protein [Roseburia sp. AM23-20]UMZ01082.1 HDOD domain-containing protein [Roseburia rectibacter]
MLVTLIPLFDENIKVSAYSLYTQKANFLLHPNLLGSGSNDGAAQIEGFELILNMGLETLSPAKEIFVPVNEISIFSDIPAQCGLPHEFFVLLLKGNIPCTPMYIDRVKALKEMGYRFAIRKLPVSSYEAYHDLLTLMDYVMLDCEQIDISKARIYFNQVYPDIRLCASNITDTETFDAIRQDKSCCLYEGSFYRLPVTKGTHKVAPLKINYIELMNLVNTEDFDLTKAADIIAHDTALVISLLRMVNHMAVNSEITSIRHAAAMLGQKELKRWINTAVVNQLCSDKPNEITRLSLLRAKFAENLAPAFELGGKASELFLTGLFSVLDIILDKPMEEALSLVKVSHDIEDALIRQSGIFAEPLYFIKQYEAGNWSEVSRLMILENLDTQTVYDAYIDALKWYRELFSDTYRS